MTRRIFLMSLAALAAPAPAQVISPAGGPVKVGGLTFLTGKFASYGQQYASGMKLGIDYVNSQGGVLGGRKLELDLQDTGSDSAQAATIVRRFAANSDIVAVLGPTGSPDFLATVPIAKSLSIPMIVVHATVRFAHEQFPDNVLRVTLVETPDMLRSFFERVQASRGIKRVAMLTDRTNDAQQASRRNALEGLSGTGLEVVSDEYVRSGDRDFAAVIDKIVTSRPDAIFLSATTNEVTLFFAQARARGFKGLFMGTVALADPKIGEIAKEYAAGAVTVLPLDENANAPLVKEFVSAYKAAHGGGAIAPYAAFSFDAVLLLAHAINRAGSTDRARVIQALGQTKGFQGVTNNFTFNGKGDNITQRPYMVEHTSAGVFRAFK